MPGSVKRMKEFQVLSSSGKDHFQRMTDNKYSECRRFLVAHNVHILPTLEEVRHSKEATYPENVTENPQDCFTSLQSLCDKTVQRTFELESVAIRLSIWLNFR